MISVSYTHLDVYKRQLHPPLIAMDDASTGYGEEPVLRRLSLSISDDDRIGLLGANGNGKSTFAKLVSGRLKALGGSVRRSSKLEVGFFAQHQIDDLDPQATPYQCVAALMREATEAKIRAKCAQLGFPNVKADTKAVSYTHLEHNIELVQIDFNCRFHIWILQLAGERGAVCGGRPVNLTERRRGGRVDVEGSKP